jgi:hypothetical protein
MLWASLLAGVVGLSVVSYIASDQGPQAVPLSVRTTLAWRKVRALLERAVDWGRKEWERRTAERHRASFSARFSSRDRTWAPPRERVSWQDRLIAVMELIVFIAILSVLFAGALAVAAFKLGHLHS